MKVEDHWYLQFYILDVFSLASLIYPNLEKRDPNCSQISLYLGLEFNSLDFRDRNYSKVLFISLCRGPSQWSDINWAKLNQKLHSVKSVRIRSFFYPYVPAFGLPAFGLCSFPMRKNTGQKNSGYGHFLGSVTLISFS